MGRRLGIPLGFTGMETSQRLGVERPQEAVPGSCTLGHLCSVDVYGLIYDRTSCAVWSLLPAIIPARNKSKPSEWVLVAWLSMLKLLLLFLCVLWVDKFKWVLCHSCVQSPLPAVKLCHAVYDGDTRVQSGSSSQSPRWLFWLSKSKAVTSLLPPRCFLGKPCYPLPSFDMNLPQIVDLWGKPCPTYIKSFRLVVLTMWYCPRLSSPSRVKISFYRGMPWHLRETDTHWARIDKK